MMEYLVTYGWALLALFFVLAFFASSGAFSAGSFSVQECSFQPDLPCSAFILYRNAGPPPNTALQFSLVNSLGFPIRVEAVNYTVSDLGTPGRNTYAGSLPAPSGVIGQGQRMNFTHTFTGTAQPQVRDFRSIIVTIKYSNCKSGTCLSNYTTSGRVSAPVEKR